MLQVSHNTSFRAAFGCRRGARSTNHAQDPHLSLIVLFCGRLLTDAVIACWSHTSPSRPFIFTQNSNWRKALRGSLLLVIHHYHLLASFYSHSKNTSAIYGQYPTKSQGDGGLKNILFYFQVLFNATLTALQMGAKYAPMLLFSLSNINPHLGACSNSGLPQPVCFADRGTDRTRERGVLCVCEARCRCHILDCCTSFFMQSRRLSSVYFWQRGMHSLTAALPNKHSCIYQRQDKTHLIWASNSLFTHSQASHLLETVVLQKKPTLGLSAHSLGSFFTDVGAN